MQSDTDQPCETSPVRQPSKPPRTRSRITAACIRCQKRKIRCDALLPACGACQRAGVQCMGGGPSREAPRSYVKGLEDRIEWLEALLYKHVPGIDLSAGPGCSPAGPRQQSPKEYNVVQIPQEADDASTSESLKKISDQIGLISLTTGADLRYLGPSSGLFFTRFVLAGLGKRIQLEKRGLLDMVHDNVSIPSELLIPQPKALPADQKHTQWLSQAYFDSVHLQFPFMHEPMFREQVSKSYRGEEVGAFFEFQIFMVLAIGATLLSRKTKVILSAEGYYASAIKLIDGVFKTSTLSGIQCILLLQMYALNNPSSGLSLWSLHHHGLAQGIELGLHRNVPRSAFSNTERELRTRSFWCIYTIDRLLSTFMGRPMGIVDEQCDLRLPLDVDEGKLESDQLAPRQDYESFVSVTSAIHLFKLARFNSEIKCVLYCVDRDYPPYTQPMITDSESWKIDILNRLRHWKDSIPRHPEGTPQFHVNIICEIKYYELVMLVLRPSPRFRNPDKTAIHECFLSAIACSKLYHQLYTTNSLYSGWMSVHSIFLCVMILFYCVWTPQGVADEVDFDSVLQALKTSSDILSAMGEYWPEAKRSRDVLDRVSMATIRRFTQNLKATRNVATPLDSQSSMGIPSILSSSYTTDWSEMDLSTSSIPPFQFEDGTVTDSLMPPNYGINEDSFITADVLSYFLGSGTDINMIGSESFLDDVEGGNSSTLFGIAGPSYDYAS